MPSDTSIAVEVAYATPEQQSVLSLNIPIGSTVEQVILASGILTQFPEINLQTQKTGIFSKFCELSTLVQAGDRIEIYRPLAQSPMNARRQRLKK